MTFIPQTTGPSIHQTIQPCDSAPSCRCLPSSPLLPVGISHPHSNIAPSNAAQPMTCTTSASLLSKTLLARRLDPDRLPFYAPRLTRPQIRVREHAVMARNCEPEIRDHLAKRMRRRAEIRKREARAAGPPTPVARATSPHFTNIQNVRFLLSE